MQVKISKLAFKKRKKEKLYNFIASKEEKKYSGGNVNQSKGRQNEREKIR